MPTTTLTLGPVQIEPNANGSTRTRANPTATQGVDSGVSGGNGNAASTATSGATPGQSGVPTLSNPLTTTGSGGASPTGGPGVSNGAGTSDTNGGGTSGGGGLPLGAIAGIVVGLIILLGIIAFLLLRYRGSPKVQRMAAPFSKHGGPAGGLRPYAAGSSPMDSGLVCAGPGAPGGAGPGAEVSVAAAAYGRNDKPLPPPPMRQTGELRPLIPVALTRHDSRRVSTFTEFSTASSGVFSPYAVSPISPTSMLSPGAVWTSRPHQEPPDPRVVPPSDVEIGRPSISSNGTGSGVSAALAPGQIAWPMPPGTPTAIQTPDGPQYVNFQQPGETVVQINIPPRPGRPGS